MSTNEYDIQINTDIDQDINELYKDYYEGLDIAYGDFKFSNTTNTEVNSASDAYQYVSIGTQLLNNLGVSYYRRLNVFWASAWTTSDASNVVTWWSAKIGDSSNPWVNFYGSYNNANSSATTGVRYGSEGWNNITVTNRDSVLTDGTYQYVDYASDYKVMFNATRDSDSSNNMTVSGFIFDQENYDWLDLPDLDGTFEWASGFAAWDTDSASSTSALSQSSTVYTHTFLEASAFGIVAGAGALAVSSTLF